MARKQTDFIFLFHEFSDKKLSALFAYNFCRLIFVFETVKAEQLVCTTGVNTVCTVGAYILHDLDN